MRNGYVGPWKTKCDIVNYSGELGKIFVHIRYRITLFLLLALLGSIFAITSNIVVPSTLQLNPSAEPIKIIMMLMIVILMSINLTVLFHNYEMRKGTVKQSTILGTLGAPFTTACPICQPIWLVWLGFGSFTAFLSDISIYIGILSFGLLLLSLHNLLKAASSTCEVKKNGKNN